MLKGYAKNYADIADNSIKEDWRKMDRSDLCYKCCEYEGKNDKMYNAYFCAILVRYWHLIKKNVAQSSGAYDEQDCYNWLVDSIIGTLSAKSWLNPNSSLFNDPIAPDKSINVRMKSHRQGFYQWSNCQKRSGDFTINNSYEQLFDAYGDLPFPIDSEWSENVDHDLSVYSLIKKEFKNKNYMGSFVVWGIINADVFDVVKDSDKKYTKFNKKKLSSFIRHLDDDFCDEFASNLGIDKKEVVDAVNICSELSRVRVYSIIDATLNSLPKKLSI